jgi:hypothetical protein
MTLKKKRKNIRGESPDLEIIRKILFWDADFSKIDWQRYYKHVIQRVFERGDEAERQEIRRFYGLEKVNEVLKDKIMDGDRIRIMSHLRKHG